jgi:hypothetical protein
MRSRTAKHVLQREDPGSHKKTWLPEVYVRLNRKDGTSDLLKVEVSPEGKQKNVFVDGDAAFDLAVMHASVDPKTYVTQPLSVDMITTEEDFKAIGIQEGSEVSFTGLFTPYIGTKKNYPIFRFGRVALLTDGKISVGPP